MKFPNSSGEPMRILAISASSRFSTRGQIDRGMNAREAAEHFCPWNSKAPRTAAVTSAGMSAEACAKMKSLPPVSPTMRG